MALTLPDTAGPATLARSWPRGRLLSDRLALWQCGGLPALFEALLTPGYLLSGFCLEDNTRNIGAWMVLVRHHERQGYATTARVIFDLDPIAPADAPQTLFQACLAAPGAQRLRVVIGFSDEHSRTIAQGFDALRFAPAGALALDTGGTTWLRAHAWEAPV
jgi:hypothetical protein